MSRRSRQGPKEETTFCDRRRPRQACRSRRVTSAVAHAAASSQAAVPLVDEHVNHLRRDAPSPVGSDNVLSHTVTPSPQAPRPGQRVLRRRARSLASTRPVSPASQCALQTHAGARATRVMRPSPSPRSLAKRALSLRATPATVCRLRSALVARPRGRLPSGASPKSSVPPLESPTLSRAVLASSLGRASRRHSRRVQDTKRRVAIPQPVAATAARPLPVLNMRSACQSNTPDVLSSSAVKGPSCLVVGAGPAVSSHERLGYSPLVRSLNSRNRKQGGLRVCNARCTCTARPRPLRARHHPVPCSRMAAGIPTPRRRPSTLLPDGAPPRRRPAVCGSVWWAWLPRTSARARRRTSPGHLALYHTAQACMRGFRCPVVRPFPRVVWACRPDFGLVQMQSVARVLMDGHAAVTPRVDGRALSRLI